MFIKFKSRILLLVALLSSLIFASDALPEVFGDGELGNGIEDERQALVATEKAHYQRFLGTIGCGERMLGTAVLLNVIPENSSNQPVLLTARHVLPESLPSSGGDCSYYPAGVSWLKRKVPSVGVSGIDKSSKPEDGATNFVEDFSRDWAIFALASWPNWTNSAIPFQLAHPLNPVRGESQTYSSFFIGFDGIEPGFKIDTECRFGLLQDGSAFQQAVGLVWDDCDSVAGSSGGVLFEQSDTTVTMVAIRVGNLFDEARYPDGPLPGDKFDRQKNINVARLIDDEIHDAIRELLSLPTEVQD